MGAMTAPRVAGVHWPRHRRWITQQDTIKACCRMVLLLPNPAAEPSLGLAAAASSPCAGGPSWRPRRWLTCPELGAVGDEGAVCQHRERAAWRRVRGAVRGGGGRGSRMGEQEARPWAPMGKQDAMPGCFARNSRMGEPARGPHPLTSPPGSSTLLRRCQHHSRRCVRRRRQSQGIAARSMPSVRLERGSSSMSTGDTRGSLSSPDPPPKPPNPCERQSLLTRAFSGSGRYG